MNNPQCVLVTGASGLLGGRLVQSLTESPNQKTDEAAREDIIVIAQGRDAGRLDFHSQHVIPLVFDFARESAASLADQLKKICDQHDAQRISVVHGAAAPAASLAQDPMRAVEVNLRSAMTVATAVRPLGVRRFVSLSSIHVFGDLSGRTVRESDAVSPSHLYGATHASSELLLRQALGDIPLTILRLSNVFGAPHDPCVECWGLVINDLCRQAVCDGQMVVRSSGHQARDFVPATRFLEVVQKLIVVRPASSGDNLEGVFHLGSGAAITIRQVAEWVARRATEMGITAKPHFAGDHPPPGIPGFEYRMDGLMNAGLIAPTPDPGPSRETWQPDPAFIQELDACLRFCQQHFA
ncbi:MAG: SDR family oxidoreductase, partial [Planctomycetota bacterium]